MRLETLIPHIHLFIRFCAVPSSRFWSYCRVQNGFKKILFSSYETGFLIKQGSFISGVNRETQDFGNGPQSNSNDKTKEKELNLSYRKSGPAVVLR